MVIGTGGYFFRLLAGSESAIEEERERLRKKKARQIILDQGGTPPKDLEAIEPTEEQRGDREHWR